MNDALIELRGVTRTFEGGRLRALDGVTLSIAKGEFVAIMGPSGCGKSTLLHLIAALDKPSEGTIVIAGHDLAKSRDLNHYRAQDVGLVFQLDNLIPSLTASENVQVPMFGQGLNGGQRKRRAEELLALVGLEGRAHLRPPLLSGGERQRVAVARALANDPQIVLADEPTGRLDTTSGSRIMDLLRRIQGERSVTVVVVTHDANVAAQADRIIEMIDGRIVETGTLARAVS
ncbi:MAG TPA: ABC transporter ATP-binding protein [Gemmatimonadales bacterium]|nr:ABC transporter ATP-binding protein [Gemmatimonadales bacterium]